MGTLICLGALFYLLVGLGLARWTLGRIPSRDRWEETWGGLLRLVLIGPAVLPFAIVAANLEVRRNRRAWREKYDA